MELGI